MSHVLEQPPPVTNNGLPHLIMMRDIVVGEGLPEDHAYLLEFGTFHNTN